MRFKYRNEPLDKFTERANAELALGVGRMMDKWGDNPFGPMSDFPKTARAFEFFMLEPASFRWYSPPQNNMIEFFRELGIKINEEVAGSIEKMKPFWRESEKLLPINGSQFEEWVDYSVWRAKYGLT